MPTYYEILNVAPGSEDIVIKAAYRALIGKYHPDKFRDNPAHAERMAKLLNEAFAVLRDPAQRAAYDARLGLGAASQGAGAKPPPRPSRPPPRPAPSSSSSSSPGSRGRVDARYAPATGGLRHGWLVVALPLAAFFILKSGAEPLNDSSFDQPPPVVNVVPSGDLDPPPFAELNPVPEPTWTESVGEGLAAEPLPASAPEPVDQTSPSSTSSGHPDLRDVHAEDRRSIELTCATERSQGPVRYNRCLWSHLDNLGTNTFPNMAAAGTEDRRSIELACATERSEGPAAYNTCLRRQLDRLPGNTYPNLRGVHAEDRRSVELACATERSQGPVRYNRCLWSHLDNLGTNSFPNMAAAGTEDRRSIELACATQRSEGPAVYNTCLRNQLASLDGR